MYTRRGVTLFACTTLLFSLATVSALAQGQKIARDNREATANERDNPQERARWFLRGRTVNGKPAPQLLHKAYQQKLNNRRLQQIKQSQARTSSTQTTPTSSTSSTSSATATQSVNPSTIPNTNPGAKWVGVGPAPSGTASVGDLDQDYGPAVGRTTVVTVDQSDTTGNTVYIGGASGGLWKSTNAADTNVQNCNTVSMSTAPYCDPSVTWTPLIDQQATLTVGAMAIKPGNNQWLLVGTGEANNSVDSYYGLGFLLSQDGGSSWTLVSSAKSASGTSTVDLHGLGTTKIAFSTDNPNLVVATMGAASGGITVGAEFADSGANTPRGIYFSTDGGQSWQQATINDPRGTIQPGSANTVIYNPNNKTFYADIRWHGLYSSPDGQTWTLLPNGGPSSLNISTNCPPTVSTTNNVCPLYRSVLTEVPGRVGANGKGEMYVFIVDSSDADQGIYQSVDGGTTWTSLSTSGITNCGDGSNGACGTAQGSYNLTLLAVPNGSATDLWAGTVNEYRCTLTPSNPASCSFANLTHTYGVCGTGAVGAFSHVHPDQHGIDFVQAKPQILFFGNDGGVYRTLNGYNTTQQTCGSAQPWVEFDNLSGTMGSMLQFVWFSQHPTDNTVFLGGTQDNGTMAKNSSSAVTSYGYSWQSVNNGDGGFNDINPINPNEWFANSPTASGHVDIDQCINSSATAQNGIDCISSDNTSTGNAFKQIVTQTDLGNDNAPFYMPFMLDPQAANHLLAGTCRLWRIDRSPNTPTSWPGFTQLTYNLDAFSSKSTFACGNANLNQVSAIAAGGPCNGTCNAGAHGPIASGTNTNGGSQVIYVGTAYGELFITTNADAGPSSWRQVSATALSNQNNTGQTNCSLSTNPYSCGYPIGGIAIDPTDPTGKTAYVAVMGFKTPHVFKTTDAGVTFTSIDGPVASTGLPDNPADAVVADPNTKGLVYVATDVGVFSSHTDSGDPQYAPGSWTEVGPSSGSGTLPNVAATALRIFGTGANTRLRVSTYGRGIWEIPVPNVPTFVLSVSPASASVNVNLGTTTFNGTITPINGYNSAVNIQCHAPTNVTCTPNVSQASTTNGAASFSLAVTGSVVGDYTVTVVGVGTDASAVTQQQTIVVHVVLPQGITLSTPAPASAVFGANAGTNFNITSTNGFSGNVTLQCDGLPSTATCSFSPQVPNVPLGGTVNESLQIFTSTTPAGTYPFTVTATSPNSQSATVSGTLVVMDFSIAAPPSNTFTPTLKVQFQLTIAANPVFTGTVSLSCGTLPAGMSNCTFTDPNSLQAVQGVTLSSSTTTATVNVSIDTIASAAAGNVTISVNGGGLAHSATVSLQLSADPNALQVTNTTPATPFIVKAGQPVSAGVTVASSYSTTVKMTCAIAPASAVGTSTCAVSPSTPFAVSPGVPQNAAVSVNTFGGVAANASVTVTATDASNSAKSSNSYPFAYSVTDYSVPSAAATAILPGGSYAVPLSITSENNYAGNVNANCVVQGTPLTCTLSPVGPYTVTGASAATLTATITGPGSSTITASGNYTVTVQTSDASFAALAHNATISVTIQDYKLATTDTAGAAKTSATVTAGQSATFSLSAVAQAGGFTGPITLDAAAVCSGLPSKSACTLNGASTGTVTLTAGGPPATLVITTTAATTASLHPLSHPNAPLFAFWTMLPGAAGIVLVGKRRKHTKWALLGIAVVLVITMTACGGGGGGSTTPPPPIPIPGTPAGPYIITLTSTAGIGSSTMSRTAQISLTVQ